MRIPQDMTLDILSAILADHWIVRRDKGGRMILCRRPVFARDRQFTQAQKGQQGRFREAAQYAKSAIGKEAIYTVMAAGTARTAYNIAIADWFHPPEIEMIDLSEWTGRPGECIHIRALDDVMVRRVMVVIVDGKGEVIEQGQAVQEEDASWWVYTTTQAAPEQASLIALAEDLPGNIVQEEVPMVGKARVA